MAIRYLIVDDEAPGRANLRMAMAAHPNWSLLAECDGAAQARRALANGQAEVVFLDVRMPVESGLVLAREICRMPQPPLLVFVTAFDEHAVDAFEVHALDYLLKPIRDARLAQTVERIAALLEHRQREAYGAAVRDCIDTGAGQGACARRISVRSVGRIEQVLVDDILWIESAGNYVELQLAGRTVLHRITFNRIASMLDPVCFLRVHRGVIVRRDQIARLASTGEGRYQLTLRCGATVAVSERYLGAVRAALASPV